MRTYWILGLCFASILFVSCSDDSATPTQQEQSTTGGKNTGGKSGTPSSGGKNTANGGATSASYGGATHVGGRESLGGTTASYGGTSVFAGGTSIGGATHSGGTISVAGQSSTGGSAVTSTSGGQSTIGTQSTAGMSSFGGTSSIGGDATGGYSVAGSSSTGVKGGETSTGGSSVATGGVSSTGGTSQTGVAGSSPIGGSVSFGGSNSEGGVSAASGIGLAGGGTSSAGGTSSTAGATSIAPGIISFVTLPDMVKTNLSKFLVSGLRPLDAFVSVNGVVLPTTSFGPGLGFSTTVDLEEGTNLIKLEIVSSTETYQSQRTIVYDPMYSTKDLRLVYVDVVTGTDLYPAVSGTIVLSPDENSILGIVPDRHVVGVASNGSEIYFSDLSVFSREHHGYLRTLAFTQNIPSNGFVVSPDGQFLFSKTERLNVAKNLLGIALPLDITTGNSWIGAPVPGGPVITSDGKKIYCCSPLNVVDIELNTTSSMGLITTTYLSDLALSSDDQTLFLSRYSNSSGSLYAFNTQTNNQIGYMNGSGDFAGEIGVLPDGNIVHGASGNPLYLGGGLSLLSWPAVTISSLDKALFPLADNLAVSKSTGEIFVSSSDSAASVSTGISVYVVASLKLKLLKRFNLGINGYKSASGIPWNNQIRKIVIAE